MAYSPPNPNGQATMANSAPVTIASNQSTVKTKLANDLADTVGTITTATSTVVATDLSGVGSVTVTIYGTYVGVNVTFEAYDGVNWVGILAQPVNLSTAGLISVTGVLGSNTTNRWNISPLYGQSQFRVRATAYTSGTANVIIEPSAQFAQYLVNVATMPTVTANLGTGGTGATSLGKAEDAVAASGDTGVAVWSVRNDGSATTPASANGDYQQISSDAKGTVFVRDSPSTTATLANVAAAGIATTLLAANTNRRSAIIYNDSTSDMYISYGGTTSSTNFTIYVPSYATVTVTGAEYSGALNGIWINANGTARVTETVI